MKHQELAVSGTTHVVTYSAGDVPNEVIFNLLRTGSIPVIDSAELNSLDNRVCCRYARRDLPGWQGCPNLTGGLTCAISSARRCVFDESNDAEIWERIREQQQFGRGES